MKPLPYNADLLKVAPRVIWFEPAEAALADPIRFLTYLMTYGTVDEIRLVSGKESTTFILKIFSGRMLFSSSAS